MCSTGRPACLQRAAPVTAIALWLGSLGLRALVSVPAAVYLAFFLPRMTLPSRDVSDIAAVRTTTDVQPR